MQYYGIVEWPDEELEQGCRLLRLHQDRTRADAEAARLREVSGRVVGVVVLHGAP